MEKGANKKGLIKSVETPDKMSGVFTLCIKVMLGFLDS